MFKRLAGVAVSLSLVAGGALAQNVTLTATFGEVSLAAGFAPDPYSVAIVAGGEIDASDALGVDVRGNACLGTIANAPDYRLQYSAGSFPLFFSVMSSGDTTLVINAPDGSWYRDDDSAGFPNPMIAFTKPTSGQYDIWVGAFAGGNPDATLYISEVAVGVAGDVAPIEPAVVAADAPAVADGEAAVGDGGGGAPAIPGIPTMGDVYPLTVELVDYWVMSFVDVITISDITATQNDLNLDNAEDPMAAFVMLGLATGAMDQLDAAVALYQFDSFSQWIQVVTSVVFAYSILQAPLDQQAMLLGIFEQTPENLAAVNANLDGVAEIVAACS